MGLLCLNNSNKIIIGKKIGNNYIPTNYNNNLNNKSYEKNQFRKQNRV